MSDANTAGYDLAFVISDREMRRMVRTAFLERLPAQGLPVELELPVSFDSQDGTFSVPGVFSARIGLPRVNFTPSRDTIVTVLGTPEQPEKTSMEVRLPFSESTIEIDFPFSSRPFPVPNLRGAVSLIIPFGYPTNSDGDSVFGLDVQELIVWLTLADDDPDPDQDNKTTLDKIVATVALGGIAWDNDIQKDFERRIADNLKSSALLTELNLGSSESNLKAAQCPTSRSTADPDPGLDPPSNLRCIDFETFRPDDNSPSFLALKANLAAATYAAGVNQSANGLGRSWIGSGERVALLMSDEFVLQSLLPPMMKRAVLEDELEGLDGDEQEDVAAEFFGNSLDLKKDIPLWLDLPLSDKNDKSPNSRIESISLAKVDDPTRSGDMVQATLKLSGGVSWYYTFDLTVRINIRFSTDGGQLGGELEMDEDRQIDVHPHAAYLLPLGIGAAILALFPFFGPLIVIPNILPVILAVIVVDIGLDMLAWCRLPGMVNEELSSASPDTGELAGIVPVLLHSAHFDDLVVRGELAVVETASVSYEGYTPQGRGTWRLEFDREPSALPQMGANTLRRDAFTDVEAAEANVICEGVTIRPANGTLLHDFGNVPLWQALNITQADLRAVAHDVDGEISLSPNSDPAHLINSAQIDPLNFGDSVGTSVRAFGVKTSLGRFALLFVWNIGNTQLRGFYRRYNQALPGVELIPLFDERGSLLPTDIRGCSKVIDGLVTVLVPTAIDSSGSVSVEVGYSHYECVTQGEFEARPILLRRPLEFTWTVITRRGDRHTLAAERPNKIVLEPRSTPSPLIPIVTGPSVTFTLGGRNNARCSFASESGVDGFCFIEVQVVEHGGRTFTAERRVEFRGSRVGPAGYDDFSRWLDILHRGVQDPSTWPELGYVVPGFEVDPPITAPDLRDQPVVDPGFGVPGVSDPPRPGRDSFLVGSASRSLDRRYMRPATRSRRTGARPQYDPQMSKDQLLKKTLRSFQELPDELRAQPKVKRYMANVMELVSSLPDPPALGAAGRAAGPPQIGWIQRFVYWFLRLVGINR